MPDVDAQQQRRTTASAFARADLTAGELWLRYFALGGSLGLADVEAYLRGTAELPGADRDVLACAVNERLTELRGRPASYSRTLRETVPRGAPMAALVVLLEGAELAPPERLPGLVAAAGEVLGVDLTVHLVDYEQRVLRPVPPPGRSPDATTQSGESTLAGWAYRRLEVLPAETDPPRLWVPLLDGAERLGVLEARVEHTADLHDPGLRAQLRWASMLIGHLVVLMTHYGDGLDVFRREQPRSVTGELIWSLLPPLTSGVDGFVVSAVVEPRHAVAGDAFDYSLSETTARLLILDAVGHDLGSGLIAAAAVAAHRSARRSGGGLYEQARVMDETIGATFEGASYATAVLAEVELATGRLRYVNAGHPPPQILRGGRLVKPLTGGRRLPLGLGPGREFSVGEEWLQPDDWLLLHTDGITEARNAAGDFFGDERLADFLEREAAAGYPPPETVRRLIQAVSAHQEGRFTDDATVLLARWTDPARMVP